MLKSKQFLCITPTLRVSHGHLANKIVKDQCEWLVTVIYTVSRKKNSAKFPPLNYDTFWHKDARS